MLLQFASELFAVDFTNPMSGLKYWSRDRSHQDSFFEEEPFIR